MIAREFGNASDIKIVQSRGSGKTWLTALCCLAICCLYPGSIVFICSGTAAQATLVLKKLKILADQNPNIANELISTGKSLVQISKDKSKATCKNSSYMESFSIESARGERAKIVVVDECPTVDQAALEAVVSPIRNYRRDISFTYGFQDYKSKMVSITSACEKTNSFYQEFERVLKEMGKGSTDAFACALDYRAVVANGLQDMDFFEKERARQPELIFAMEYGSKFIGSNSNSAFPYDLTSSCRTLRKVELQQPKNSKSRYVISVDIATSEAKDADNSIISVIKFVERNDGSYAKKLVMMRSFRGKALDILADEVRALYHLGFPNTEKIVYDARGLGDSFDRFFDAEWIDPITGKEYPPLVVDDKPNMNPQAETILHPFRAVQSLNQRIYTNMRVALEKKAIELPVNSRIIQEQEATLEDGVSPMTPQEKAVYLETDALTLEMGNIVGKLSSQGHVLYDVPSNKYHKDRYSSLAMGIDYICELEKDNIKRHTRRAPCIGFASRI